MSFPQRERRMPMPMPCLFVDEQNEAAYLPIESATTTILPSSSKEF
jgi:hypothetical protein